MPSDRRRQELARMHAVATGLLIAMAALFLAASLLRETYPWLGYVRAFAEAAMVGALADWFAVVALFRHPLGLPIPHTAVIARNKERIGDSLGRFVEEHFLPPDVIRTRLAGVDFGQIIARWLADPGHAAALATQLTRLLPDLLRALDNEGVRGFVRDKLLDRLRAVEVAPLSGDILAALTADRRHQRLLDEALRQIIEVVAEKEPAIRQKVRDATGWLWKKLSVDERAFNGVMNALASLVREVEENPDHELRQRFDRLVQTFVRRLRGSRYYRRQAEILKEEVLGSPAFQGYLESLWDDLRRRLLADLAAPDPEIRRRLEGTVVQLGETLLADPGLRSALNPWLRDSIASLVEARRGDVARLIPDTVRTWDGETMARRLELQVGKDLQFIRINGTLVGGLVGLLIYLVTKWTGL